MFDGRIYRAAFLPLLLVLVIVGFSLSRGSHGMSSTLAPDAFNGARAFATLRWLVAHYPDRRPGSAGDERLARYVAQAMLHSGGAGAGGAGGAGAGGAGAAGGGFQVSVRRFSAQTIDGERTLSTVVGERPGSTGQKPIVLVAHRDAALPGSAAELSGTAALLELARVFAHSETQRTIVLVSTSGGSGGAAGARQLAAEATRPLDAAIVLGDIAGVRARRPFVVPFSSEAGAAPEQLTRTLQQAISQEVGVDAGQPGVAGQLAHMSFPLLIGEQGALDAAGVPTALVQVSAERGPRAHEAISQARLQDFGRAVLSAVYALDEGPDVKARPGPRLQLGNKVLPGWSVRLLALALLLPVLFACGDALARVRRRRKPIGRLFAWVLSCACPLLATALFVMLLGRLRIIAAPAGQPSAQALASVGSLAAGTAASMLVLMLALLAWPALVRRLKLALRPADDGAVVALMLTLLAVCLLAWVLNPFACLLLIAAAHACLLVCSSATRPRSGRLLALALSLAPFALVLAVYAAELGLGPLGLAQSAVLLLAGGQVGLLWAGLWSVAFGCLLAMPLLGGGQVGADDRAPLPPERITIRGPLSYAGPGSLGGTESALRR